MKLIFLNKGGLIPYNGIYLVWSDDFDFYYKKKSNTGIALIYDKIEEYKILAFKKYIL